MRKIKDPLIEYHEKHPRVISYPQWVFTKRARLGFCNSPRAYSLMKKQEIRIKAGFSHLEKRGDVLVEIENDARTRTHPH